MFEQKFIEKTVFVLYYCLFLFACTYGANSNKIGINYGRLGNNLPSAYQSIENIRSLKVNRVKLYDANPEVLQLLSGTKIQVSIMVTNDEIALVASSPEQANQWVHENVLAYYPSTLIRYVLVGNEVLSFNDTTMWANLVPAMRNIKLALGDQNVKSIKVGTPLAMDMLGSSYPPSSATFRPQVRKVMVPLLHFLNSTKGFFFVDVYPYFPWSSNPRQISLDFALLRSGNTTFRDPVSGHVYTNLLDQMLDSVVFAMEKLGFGSIKLAVAETGWPTGGDIDEPGANVYNAAVYNRNLVQKMTATPPIGTPARPGTFIPTFIFSLYNENEKSGRGTERHWGILDSSGKPEYQIDLTGKQSETNYPPLPEPTNNEPYSGELWCVVADEDAITTEELNRATSLACEGGDGICDALDPDVRIGQSSGALEQPVTSTA